MLRTCPVCGAELGSYEYSNHYWAHREWERLAANSETTSTSKTKITLLALGGIALTGFGLTGFSIVFWGWVSCNRILSSCVPFPVIWLLVLGSGIALVIASLRLASFRKA